MFHKGIGLSLYRKVQTLSYSRHGRVIFSYQYVTLKSFDVFPIAKKAYIRIEADITIITQHDEIVAFHGISLFVLYVSIVVNGK